MAEQGTELSSAGPVPSTLATEPHWLENYETKCSWDTGYPVCSAPMVQFADVESNDAISECFRKLPNANTSMLLGENTAAIMYL